MRQPTEMMQSILTDEMAQRIIDFVPQVYGNSYVGLWTFQAIGAVLGEVYAICTSLMNETTPATSTLLLDYWEDQYGILRDSSLTTEQRRSRIVRKTLSRGPCNPATLAVEVSNALGGARVDVAENVAKNTFAIVIRDNVDDITPAYPVIERMKPAHLLCEIRIESQNPSTAEINVGVAMTHTERYVMEVTQ